MNATVYGWLTNAGFAAVAFMTPRLLGRRLAMEKALNGAYAVWNLSLAGGIAALYVFDLGPNAPLTAFPWLIDGGLALGALIVTGAFFATVATSLRDSYVSLWFAGVALLSLLGLVSLNAGLGLFDFFFEVPELLIALVSVYIERATSTLWLLGMAYATLYYVVPRATGQPLAWSGIGMLTFITWLVLAPVAALAPVVDVSIPYAITSVGIVATMLLLAPAALTVVNLVQTMQGRWTLVFGAGAAAFAIVSLAFLFAASLLEAIGALRAVDQFVGGTDWDRGAFLWAAYGTFTFAAFALAEHALPRILRRSWGGGFLSGAQLWLAFGGVTPGRPRADGRRTGGGVTAGTGNRARRGRRRRDDLSGHRVRRRRDGRPGRAGVPDEPVPDVHQRRAGGLRRSRSVGAGRGRTLSR